VGIVYGIPISTWRKYSYGAAASPGVGKKTCYPGRDESDSDRAQRNAESSVFRVNDFPGDDVG